MPVAPEHLYAFTDDGNVRLRLDQSAWDAFAALPKLPPGSIDDVDYIPPMVDALDHDTGRVFEISRWWCGADCGCAAWAEPVDLDDLDEDEPLVAFTCGGDEVSLTLSPEDIAEFNALPQLPREMPEDFEPPTVIVTDIVAGGTYWMARAMRGTGYAAYVEDITESWEAFLAEENDLDGEV
jgi:hypothetical protein